MASWLSKARSFLAVPRNRYIVLGGVAGTGMLLLWRNQSARKDLAARIFSLVSEFEGDFDNVSPDRAYDGWHDYPRKDSSGNTIPPHLRPSYPNYEPHKYSRFGGSKPMHMGLVYGFVQFTQSSGGLGKLLAKMRAANPSLFASMFGGQACSDELVQVLNGPDGETKASDPNSHTGYVYWPHRVKAVCGTQVYQEPWLSKFKAAGVIPEFQKVQLDAAISQYFEPAMAKTCKPLNITSEKLKGVVVDRSVHMGPTGASNLITPILQPYKSSPDQVKADVLVAAVKGEKWANRVTTILASPTLSW
jgi:hypothetical protein